MRARVLFSFRNILNSKAVLSAPQADETLCSLADGCTPTLRSPRGLLAEAPRGRGPSPSSVAVFSITETLTGQEVREDHKH